MQIGRVIRAMILDVLSAVVAYIVVGTLIVALFVLGYFFTLTR